MQKLPLMQSARAGTSSNINKLNQSIKQGSFVAVGLPAPRRYQKHDLITIIVRESVINNSRSRLDTDKEYANNAKINAIPRLRLSDLLQFQSSQSDLSDGSPEIAVEFKGEFNGDGRQRQSSTFTARLQARIIDIKPNSTMVLEARKKIFTDGEGLRMVLTGVCRKEDITVDNTILSTQLANLSLVKEQMGELRKTTKKGWLTKFFDAIFNF